MKSMACRVTPFALTAFLTALAATNSAASDIDEALRNQTAREYEELSRQLHQHNTLGKRLLTDVEVAHIHDPNALILDTDRTAVQVVLRRTRALLDDLKAKGGSPRRLAQRQRRLDALTTRAGNALHKSTANTPGDDAELFAEITGLRRALAFENPLLDFDKILFVERGIVGSSEYDGNHMCDQYYGHNGRAGGGMYILEDPFGASPRLVDVIGEGIVQEGPMKGRSIKGGAFVSPDLHWDGETIAFAWSPGGGEKWARANRFRLFKVNADGSGLVQLTDDDNDDFDPCWLPNDRLVFNSTRRGGYGRCHGRPVPTYTLHSCKADGSDLFCIDWHETNEWHPSVDNQGMIVYTRWDYVDRADCIAHHIWHCYPDGRDPRAWHGNYPLPWSRMPGEDQSGGGEGVRPMAELNIRAIPGSGKYIATSGPHHGEAFGELILIDISVPDDGAMSQVTKITPGPTHLDKSDQGGYGTAWPLSEDYYMCNYGAGIYLLDKFGNRELVYTCSKAGLRPLDPMPLRARTRPPALATQTWQGERAARADHKPATISILDVNIGDYPLPPGTTIKWMRIIQLIPKTTPNKNSPGIGFASETLARMPLGIVPVEADGSVYCEAPVGKAIYFQLLDERGLAVMSMRSDTYVHPGEQLSCIGCHESKWEATPPMGARIATSRAPSRLEPEVIEGAIPFNYHTLAKPVFQSKCLPCHQQQGQGPDFSYGSVGNFTHAFAFPGDREDMGREKFGGSRTTPGQFGAMASGLLAYLDPSHHGGDLTDQEFRRITLWLDCNSNQYGSCYNLDAQERGEVVWPALDVDPENPLGLEDPRSDLPASRLRVTPPTAIVRLSAQAQFTAEALDIFGRPLVSPPQMQWRVDGGGSIDPASGLFTAGDAESGPHTVTVTTTAQGATLQATATVLVSNTTDAALLPGGYVRKMLVLADGSDYVIPAVADPWSSTAPPSIVVEGTTAAVNDRTYTWTGMESPNGMWAEAAADNFVAYFSITILGSAPREVGIVYRHDDDLRIWNNGTVVVDASGWDGGSEKTSSTITLARGHNTLVARIRDTGGGNHFAMKFVDESGTEINDLLYVPLKDDELPCLQIRPENFLPRVALHASTLVVHAGLGGGECRVELFDLRGARAGTWRLSGGSQYSLPLPRACGSYVVRLRRSGNTVSEKLVMRAGR